MPTLQNLGHMLNEYGVKIRYNEMKRTREIAVPGKTFALENADNVVFSEIDNLTVINNVVYGDSRLNGFLLNLACQDSYHPVREWIQSIPWDGVSRFQLLADTIAVEAKFEAHRNSMLRRWLISAIAALYSKNPNDKFELVLTFQGVQGKGKTSWFKRLVAPSLGAVKEGVKLDPNNKDIVFMLCGHWIVELGELDSTFSKSEISSIKAFMSNASDKLRRPYERFDSNMKRQTVMGATVNKPDFLIDDTGNRRWLTVPAIGVEYMHTIDMQQLWAEVRTWYDAGEQWWLTQAEAERLSHVNTEFEAVLPVYEMLVEAFDFTEPKPDMLGNSVNKRKFVRITATQVLTLFGLPKDRRNVSEAGAALRKLTGKHATSFGGARVWKVSPRSNSTYATQVRIILGEAA